MLPRCTKFKSASNRLHRSRATKWCLTLTHCFSCLPRRYFVVSCGIGRYAAFLLADRSIHSDAFLRQESHHFRILVCLKSHPLIFGVLTLSQRSETASGLHRGLSVGSTASELNSCLRKPSEDSRTALGSLQNVFSMGGLAEWS